MAGMSDLNRMFKRGQKFSKKVPIKANSWLKNVTKSFGYAAQEILTDVSPNAIDLAASGAEVANTLRESFLQGKSQSGKVKSALDISTYINLGKEYGRNAIDDLMSGNFYNKEREQALYDEATGGSLDDFGFDDDFDMGEDFDDDFSIDADSDTGNASAVMTRKRKGRNEVTQVNVYNGFDEDSPIVKSTEFQTKVQVEATGVMVDTQKASTQALLTHTTKLHKQTLASLVSMNDKLGQIHASVSENQTRLINVSETYYNDSMEMFRQMLDQLTVIKEHTAVAAVASAARQTEDYNDLMDMFSGGKVSISDYSRFVKKNLNNAIESNMFTSTLKSYLTDKDVMKQMVTTPLRFVVTDMVKQLIPNMVQTSMKQFDETLGEFAVTALTKVGSWKNRYDNPLLRTLGEIFGISNKYETSADKSKYNKGAVAWDGISHRTLNDVIPTYLRRIEAALTGREEIVFDYDRGVYRKLSDVQKTHKDDMDAKRRSPFFDDTQQFSEFLNKNFVSGNKEDLEKIQQSFDTVLKNLVSRGGIDTYQVVKDKDGNVKQDELASLLGTNTGDRDLELIRAFFEGRHRAGNNAANARTFGRSVQDARANVSRYTREMEADPIKYNGQYIDNGLAALDKKTGRTAVGIGGFGGKDKYDNTVFDYLRKTLVTLNNGIKVYVTNWGGNGIPPSPIDIPGIVDSHGNRLSTAPVENNMSQSILDSTKKSLDEYYNRKNKLKDDKDREDTNKRKPLSEEEYQKASLLDSDPY